MNLIPKPQGLKARVHAAQHWRDRQTHRFVSAIFAKFLPDRVEPVPGKDRDG